jgi:hypothetical protein
VPTASNRSEPYDDPNGWRDLEFDDLLRTQHLGSRDLVKDAGERSLALATAPLKSAQRRRPEIPFFWTRSRAVFMQWLNRPERCDGRDVRRELSSDAPADRDVHERRAKFFSPEIFGPSK